MFLAMGMAGCFMDTLAALDLGSSRGEVTGHKRGCSGGERVGVVDERSGGMAGEASAPMTAMVGTDRDNSQLLVAAQPRRCSWGATPGTSRVLDPDQQAILATWAVKTSLLLAVIEKYVGARHRRGGGQSCRAPAPNSL